MSEEITGVKFDFSQALFMAANIVGHACEVLVIDDRPQIDNRPQDIRIRLRVFINGEYHNTEKIFLVEELQDCNINVLGEKYKSMCHELRSYIVGEKND